MITLYLLLQAMFGAGQILFVEQNVILELPFVEVDKKPQNPTGCRYHLST